MSHARQVEVSLLEIYNEQLRDLLVEAATPATKRASLRIRESPDTGPYVEGLIVERVVSAHTMKKVIATGLNRRTTATTSLNVCSSRAHTLCQIAFTRTLRQVTRILF